MKNFYLFLAVTAVVVTCKPQRSNNDIIWYPVDDEDGVFISIYGEKYRTAPQLKYRSHRRARFSGFDPTENRDPSFFHNVQDRRRTKSIPSVPVSLQQQYPKNPFFNPGLLSQKNKNEKNDNFQDIINEVFDINRQPPGDGFSGGGNVNSNQWGNQWSSNNNNNNNQNEWGGANQWKPNENTTPNQWGSGSNSALIQKPPDSEWISTEKPKKPNNQNRPNNNRPNRPNRPNKPNKPNRKTTTTTTTQSDKLVFPDETPVTPPSRRTTTASGSLPVDPPTLSPCELTCPVTPEFNPVCGTDSVTYTNTGRLKCAQLCGKDVELSHHGNCGRTKLVTPLLSDTFREKRKERFQRRDWD